MGATDKQISYAMALLGKAGFRTDFMDKHFSEIGAGMRDRSGRVQDWLRRMNKSEISSLIDTLKAKAA